MYSIIDVFFQELKRRYSSENLGFFVRSPLWICLPKTSWVAQYNRSTSGATLQIGWRSKNGDETGQTHTRTKQSNYMAFTELNRAWFKNRANPSCQYAHTAGWERTFSKFKLMKSHLRTTMSDERLNNFSVTSMHRQRALNIDLDLVMDQFIHK